MAKFEAWRMTDAELIAAVNKDAAGKYRYEVNVDEGRNGGLYYVVNADNAEQAKWTCAEHAARIRSQRVWKVYVVGREKRTTE